MVDYFKKKIYQLKMFMVQYSSLAASGPYSILHSPWSSIGRLLCVIGSSPPIGSPGDTRQYRSKGNH